MESEIIGVIGFAPVLSSWVSCDTPSGGLAGECLTLLTVETMMYWPGSVVISGGSLPPRCQQGILEYSLVTIHAEALNSLGNKLQRSSSSWGVRREVGCRFPYLRQPARSLHDATPTPPPS